MVILEEDFAVIATVNLLLKQNEKRINIETIKSFSRDLESNTGKAIINGFTNKSLKIFFDSYPEYFQKLSNFEKIETSYIIKDYCFDDIVENMIKRFDPKINYPFDLLEDSGILDKILK